MSIRKFVFWIHLAAGSIAGIVILIMCITGVMLAYERQILLRADREFRHPPPAATTPHLPADTLLANARAAHEGEPTSLILRSDRDMPAAVEFGRESILYLNPYTGRVLGEGNKTARAWFRSAEDWHRWLARTGTSRDAARTVTGFANFIFLFLVTSGIVLWWPRTWDWRHLRPVVWFRRGLGGRARDWNWHNTIGFWCAVPLFVIVLCSVVMSFPWANNLVYTMTGNQPPAAAAGGRGGGPVSVAKRDTTHDTTAPSLDPLWERAEAQTPDWKTITMRAPATPRAPVAFTIDQGDGGRPDLKGTLTLNRKTAEVVRWEPFSSGNSGRQLRSWIRFTHTGEAGGIAGETAAVVAAAGGVAMVWTGFAMAIRRLLARIARRAVSKSTTAAEVVSV